VGVPSNDGSPFRRFPLSFLCFGAVPAKSQLLNENLMKMKSGNNDVSVIVSITAAAALTYGVVIWRARAVARRMEEDVTNVWIGDGTPMVSD